MYGNNFNPYGMTNMSYRPMMVNPMMPRLNSSRGIGSILGLSSRGLSRGINWSSLLNNASKTLGVIKEAIPVVREVQPMLHNMRSIVKIASAFKDETDATPSKNIDNTVKQNTSSNSSDTSNVVSKTNTNNEPNFFI